MENVRMSAVLAVFLTAGAVPKAQSFLDHQFTWVSPDTICMHLDGFPKFKVRVVNAGATNSPDRLSMRFTSPDYPHPSGGFAWFPNGGAISLAPGESTTVSIWSNGISEMQPPAGLFTRNIGFRFILDDPQNRDSSTFSRNIVFENGPNPLQLSDVAGAMAVSGTVTTSAMNIRVALRTAFSNAINVPIQFGPQGATFSLNFLRRDDWYLTVDAQERLRQVLRLVPDSSTGLSITLAQAPSNFPRYELVKTETTPTGFWRGAVSESEGTVVFFPGQENWKRTNDNAQDSLLLTQSRVYKYSFAGAKLWEHAPSWQVWGGGMSEDGAWVVYVLDPTFYNFRRPSQFTMVVLDGQTGQVYWNLSDATNSPTGRKLEALEASISADGKWIAVGSTASGQITLFDREAKSEVWSLPQSGQGYGQIRKLLFDKKGEFLYAGSGDNYLRKIRVSNGEILWRAFIGGWPFVNGLVFSPDSVYLYSGTKSFDMTKVRVSDGAVAWQREIQHFDADVSPDGTRLANFGPRHYNASAGEIVGFSRNMNKHFTRDGNYLLGVDRNVVTLDLAGGELHNSEPSGIGGGPGEQVQWSYLTADNEAVIVAARDMNNPPQAGLAFYRKMAATGVAGKRARRGGEDLQVFPGTLGTGGHIRFRVQDPGPVSLHVLDLSGKRVSTVFEGHKPAGWHRFPLRAAGLPKGMLLVRAVSGGGTLSKTLPLIH